MRRIKLFEGFSRSHPQYTEQELKSGISDCLVELNDLGNFEYQINIDLNDNYVCVIIKVDESDVPDEEYFHTTKTFDCTDQVIADSVMFLSDYMRETFGSNLYTEYWIYDSNDYPFTLTEYPTKDYLLKLEEEEEEDFEDNKWKIDSIQLTTKLMIKYKW
jgi:hypothetical protein